MKELLEEQNIVRICDCCGTATIDIDRSSLDVPSPTIGQ